MGSIEPDDAHAAPRAMDPATAPVAALAPATRTNVVDWTGKTPDGVQACEAVEGDTVCLNQTLIDAGDDTLTLRYSGEVVELTIRLTWTPEDELHRLKLTLEQAGHVTRIDADGPTTIVLGPEAGLEPDGSLRLHVASVLAVKGVPIDEPPSGPLPVSWPQASADANPHEFTIQAVFVTLPAPTPAP